MSVLLAAGLGVGIGLVLGVSGAGGAIFAVPLLMWGLGWSLPQAAPVALLAVCTSSVIGTLASWDTTHIRYRAAMLLALTGTCAAPLGLGAAHRLPAHFLTALFAAVLALVGARMFRQAFRAGEPASTGPKAAGNRSPDAARSCRLDPVTGRFIWTRRCFQMMASAGAATGFLSGLLGVGGGFVIVPTLRAVTDLSMHSAVATSLMAIALTSAGTVGVALLQGFEIPWPLALPFVGGSVAGMLAGRRLASHIAERRLQQVFSSLMLLVAAILAGQALLAHWR